MAKQRRDRARPAPPKTRKSKAKSEAGASPGRAVRQQPAHQYQPPQPRQTYVEAVALYERGLQALQTHDFATAGELLRAVLSKYPEEKELHERVLLYLNICDRQAAPQPPSGPRSVEERLYAATLSLNAGNPEPALSHIDAAIAAEPQNDHAHYMRAVALTQAGRAREALKSLTQAIELNPENRALARQDPDLEPLREDVGLRQAVDALTSAPRSTRRRLGFRRR